MNFRRRHNGKDFLLGAMIGSTLGALSAALLHTKQGTKARKEIVSKYHEFHNAVQKFAHRPKVQQAIRSVKKGYRGIKAKLRAKPRRK